jgi:caffeoyl-CoA O-methyltransferase
MGKIDPENIIEKYIRSVSTEEDTVLSELNRYTYLKAVHPQMISGQVQGKFLEMISFMLSPLNILEIGTFTGYSAICLARGLRPGGKLITIEINDELKEISSVFFLKAGIQDKIELITGDAITIIPTLNYKFDLVFIDGEKEQYIDYYELAKTKVREGGFILADNTLWDGKILDDPGTWDSATRAIFNFNQHVQKDPQTDNVIIPLRDGISLIRICPSLHTEGHNELSS